MMPHQLQMRLQRKLKSQKYSEFLIEVVIDGLRRFHAISLVSHSPSISSRLSSVEAGVHKFDTNRLPGR